VVSYGCTYFTFTIESETNFRPDPEHCWQKDKISLNIFLFQPAKICYLCTEVKVAEENGRL
jgi:hypothetical protein